LSRPRLHSTCRGCFPLSKHAGGHKCSASPRKHVHIRIIPPPRSQRPTKPKGGLLAAPKLATHTV
jgi:hypothetical protein